MSVTCFQFVSQKRKQEAEERRSRMRRAREDFRKMLEVISRPQFILRLFCTSIDSHCIEKLLSNHLVPFFMLFQFSSQESKELTSSSRWRSAFSYLECYSSSFPPYYIISYARLLPIMFCRFGTFFDKSRLSFIVSCSYYLTGLL